jgi:diadenosine tetraphosphate (Ap4A) HIT family hydrolase
MKKTISSLLLYASISLQAEQKIPFCPQWLCGAFLHQKQRCVEKHINCPFCNREKLTTAVVEDDNNKPYFVTKKCDGDGFLVVLRDPCNDLRDCPTDLKRLLLEKAEQLAEGRPYWILVNNGSVVGQSIGHLHVHVGFDLNPNQKSKQLAQELKQNRGQINK